MSISITQFNHLRIPLHEIEKATNNFSEENKIGKSDFGYIYEGQLSCSGELINISAKRLDPSQGLRGKEIDFLTEVSVLSGLKHPNIVSLIGFCDEKGEKIIINSHEAKGSLGMYLSDPALTWIQRLKISIGVAHAISYIHYEEGRSYSIIHRNINSSTILLDDNFEAKLSGFEFSIKNSMDRMERYIPLEVVGTQGYMDMETIKSGYVTQKSDMYSFGVVLCEIMCGRKAFLPNEEVSDRFLAPLAIWSFQTDTLQDIISHRIFNQMAPGSYELFMNVVISSIQEDPKERPDMNMCLYNLNAALHRQVPSLNPSVAETFTSLGVKKDENDALQLPSKDELGVVVNNERKVNKLEHLRIPFIDIQSATDYFSEDSVISRERTVDIHKGDLEWFDKKYVSSLKGKNISEIWDDGSVDIYKGALECLGKEYVSKMFDKEYVSSMYGLGEVPNRRSNVRIMCYKDVNVDSFYREIEIISTCKHDNIDSLLGFCDVDSHKILVFEGNNYNLLVSKLGSQDLTWDIRLKICLDVAHGLKYIHNEMEDQKMVIHRLLTSTWIWLDDDWQGAKISGFTAATFRQNIVDENFHFHKDNGFSVMASCFMAPEFSETCKATKESDIYSFGLLMFEILCGESYLVLRMNNAEFRAEHWFKDGKIKQRVAQVLKEENRGNKLFLKEGPNEDSLDTFIEITEQCLAANPKQRPTTQVIVEQLEKALLSQKNHKDHLRMSFEDIESATQNFSCANEIGDGGFGRVYKGELVSEHGSSTIVAKRLDASQGQGDQQFKNELHILSEYKHENVIGLVGYSNDEQERIIVYEYASKGSLDRCLNDASLTWINRLNICIDVARGLAFLHGGVQEHEAVIHRDIKTANILLFDDWKAKIADYGLSLICTISDETDYVIDRPSGTHGYLDPVYQKSGFLTKESDIYSLGVVLLEILCGRLTYMVYKHEGRYLQSLVKQHFEEGRLDEVVFNAIKEQILRQSLATFLEVAFQCLHDDKKRRPTAQDVLVQLEKALELQENHDHLRMSFKDIESATQNFSRANDIGGGGFGRVYKGNLAFEHGSSTIVAKRLDASQGQGDQQFKNELHILSEYKHENVIGLVGYSNDEQERIIVYEYASKGSLDRCLNDASLTWINRLNICIDVARGLAFLHGGVQEHEAVIHRDIKTANILLFDDWKAKVADYGLSLICTISDETDYVIDRPSGTHGYLDPVYQKSGFLTKESDIYSLGVVLLEILCGRLTYKVYEHEGRYLHSLVKQRFEEGRLDEVVFNAIKDQILPQSLATFLEVAFQCLHDDREKRPTAQHVLVQLQKALELQEEEPSKWQGILDLCCCFRD